MRLLGSEPFPEHLARSFHRWLQAVHSALGDAVRHALQECFLRQRQRRQSPQLHLFNDEITRRVFVANTGDDYGFICARMCDDVVQLTKTLLQIVLLLQMRRETSESRTTFQKVVTQHRPARKVCAPSAHSLFWGDSGVSRLSGMCDDFVTFLSVHAGTEHV